MRQLIRYDSGESFIIDEDNMTISEAIHYSELDHSLDPADLEAPYSVVRRG